MQKSRLWLAHRRQAVTVSRTALAQIRPPAPQSHPAYAGSPHLRQSLNGPPAAIALQPAFGRVRARFRLAATGLAPVTPAPPSAPVRSMVGGVTATAAIGGVGVDGSCGGGRGGGGGTVCGGGGGGWGGSCCGGDVGGGGGS